MRTIKTRIFSCLLVVMLAIPAFSVSALAAGTEPEAAESIPTTGGIEFDAPETDTDSSLEDTEDTEDDASKEDTEETEASADTAAILSELLGKLNITATENGDQITSGDADGSAASQTGTVTTGGSNLNVRTGAGTENPAITQLPNGTQVEVIGTEGGWYKIRLPEREGYVCGDYLTVSETVGGDGSFSLSLTEEETAALLELFGGFSGSSALTPDGNLTLIDDIGSSSQAGKQFITVESKNGNVFYLIIDRDDDGEETVHFLNQVDEADLMALTEDGETQPAACSCTERCQAGAVNMDCELCAQDMTACVGPEPEPEETETPEQEETEPEAEESSGLNPAVLLLVLALVGGGGAFAYFKLVKNKPKTKGNDDLDDYDYGEDSEDADDTGEDEIWETEDGDPDEDDPDAGGGGDEESETPVK